MANINAESIKKKSEMPGRHEMSESSANRRNPNRGRKRNDELMFAGDDDDKENRRELKSLARS